MKHSFLTALAVASALSSVAAPRSEAPLFRYMPEPKAVTDFAGNPQRPSEVSRSRADGARVETLSPATMALKKLPASDDLGYLDMPNGEVWYYTVAYDKENVKQEAYTEVIIKGFKLTVYDTKLDIVGTVEDAVTMDEGETKLAQLQITPTVTKKFFNYDDKYEIMVGLAFNTSKFVNHYRTVVYSIGNNTPLATFQGYVTSAVNSATDAWSEKFWITFMTEEETTTPEVNGIVNVVDLVFNTYKSAGYSGMGDPALTVRVPQITVAGENAMPFISTVSDGKPWFAVNRMKYCWYEDPFDYNNDNPTPDNELMVDLYTLESSWDAVAKLYSTTTIPSTATIDDLSFLYLGDFSYDNDLSFGRYSSDGLPSLIITRQHYTSGNDSYTYDYYVYSTAAKSQTAAGEKKITIAENVTGGYFMQDIKGFDPQVLFIVEDGDSYKFNFVSLVTGETEVSLPYMIAENVYLTVDTERIPSADGYVFAAAQTRGASQDNGDVYTAMAYIARDGQVDHIDYINVGKNVDLAQIYSYYDGFDPYIFNLDDNREYMALVKRKNDDGKGNHEELLVVSSDPEAEPLLQLGPDEEMGSIANIAFVNLDGDDPRLVVSYVKNYSYTFAAHQLPLVGYEQGSGSRGRPYVITTVGGLQHISASPDAYYVLGCDIDASGHTLKTSKYEFTGVLDGKGYTISNLDLDRALIPTVMKPSDADYEAGVVRNLNFVNPTLEASAEDQAILASVLTGATISNVHIYDAKVSSDNCDVAGLVGRVSLYSTVSECSFNGSIVAPENSVGGIALNLVTSSAIKACAVSGSINGGSEVGGIVATLNANAAGVSDCHVDAAIKAKNTVGGIAGDSGRALIANCHVEGSIEATENPRWGGGPKAGGIVGNLAPDYSAFNPDNEQTEPAGPAVKNCYVDLTSLSYTGQTSASEEYPGQNDTMHRIVGASVANAEPDVIDYDSEYNPVYGDPREPDAGLKGNYAVASLNRVSDKIDDALTSTEGKSVASEDTSVDFFTAMGWKYGNDVDNPWNQTGDVSHPELYFEGGLLTVTPAVATVEAGSEITFSLSLHGIELTEELLEGFAFEIADEAVAEAGDMEFDGKAINIVVKGLAEGSTKITFGLNGKQAEAELTVVRNENSITEINGDKTAAISYVNHVARCEGSRLSVYNAAGSLLRQGRDAVSLVDLPAGIYIVATDRASLKVVR